MHQCDELARRIIATPAHTSEALAGKRRTVQHANYDDGDSLIISTILDMDAERIDAGEDADI
jgi:hypothetical protein